MGILDDLLGKEKKPYKEKEPGPLAPALRETQSGMGLAVRFLPVRLAAKKDNKVDMIVKITNNTSSRQLVSFEAFLPPREMVGFDSTVINKHYERKLGNIEAGAGADFAVTVYGTSQTRPGNYPVGIVVNVHYLDYNKVMPTGVKRKIYLRVV